MVRRTPHLRLVWNAAAPVPDAAGSTLPDLTPRVPTPMPARDDAAAALLVREAVGGPSGFLWRVAEVLSLVSLAPGRVRLRRVRLTRLARSRRATPERLPS